MLLILFKLLIASSAFLSISLLHMIIRKFPRTLLVLYLLTATYFLGFVNINQLKRPDSIGIPDPIFVLNIILLLQCIHQVIYDRSKIALFILFFTSILILYGVFYPVINGHSNFFSALRDGKDFFCYYLISYLILYRNNFQYDFLYKIINIIAVSLSLIVLLYIVTGLHPPNYHPILEGRIFNGIHIRFATFILLAFTLSYAHFLVKGFSLMNIILLSLYFLATALQGHRSVLIACCILIIATPMILKSMRYSIKVIGISLLVILTIIFLDKQYMLTPVTSGIMEIIHNEGAIYSRSSLNSLRISYLYDNMLFGYGFIDEQSSLGAIIKNLGANRFSQTLGTVDSGYIDLLLRFGIIGTILILTVYVYFSVKYLKLSVTLPAYDKRCHSVALTLFIMSYFGINLTWSVISYIHGIIPVSLVVFMLLQSTNQTFRKQFKYSRNVIR